MTRIRRTGIGRWMALAVLLVIAACEGKPTSPPAPKTSSTAGKPLPAVFHSMPANTILAVGLTDLDSFRTALKQTTLNEMWEDPNLKTWREQSWPKFKAILAQKAGVTADELDGLVHGDALLVICPRSKQPNQPAAEPRGALLLKPSTNKPQLEAFVQKMLARQAANKPVTKWAGDILIITDDDALASELEANLKAGRSPLEGSKAFDVLQNAYDTRSFGHLWVSIEKILSRALEEQSPDERAKAQKAMSSLGLSNLSGVYARAMIQKKGFVVNGRIKLEGGRQGIFALMGDNAPSKAVRLVPPDTPNFYSIRHAGLDNLVSLIRSTALATSAVTEQNWQAGVTMANAIAGINVETDLPKLFGREIAVSWKSSVLLPQINVYLESPDPTTLTALIEKMLATRGLVPTPAEQQGMKYKSFSLPLGILPLSICYASVGEFLVISSDPAGLLASLSALTTKKSLADSPEYVQAMAEAGPPGFFESYTKLPKEAGPKITMAAQGLLPILNQALGGSLTVADIPNFQVMLDHATPSAGRMRTTADALESQGYTPGAFDPSSLARAGSMRNWMGFPMGVGSPPRPMPGPRGGGAPGLRPGTQPYPAGPRPRPQPGPRPTPQQP